MHFASIQLNQTTLPLINPRRFSNQQKQSVPHLQFGLSWSPRRFAAAFGAFQLFHAAAHYLGLDYAGQQLPEIKQTVQYYLEKGQCQEAQNWIQRKAKEVEEADLQYKRQGWHPQALINGTWGYLVFINGLEKIKKEQFEPKCGTSFNLKG